MTLLFVPRQARLRLRFWLQIDAMMTEEQGIPMLLLLLTLLGLHSLEGEFRCHNLLLRRGCLIQTTS